MVCTKQGGSADFDSVISGLNNGILLRMKATAKFVSFSRGDPLFFSETARIQAMLQSGRRSIIACREDFLIFDQDGADLPSQTGRPFGNEMSDIHEILFPRGAMGGKTLFLFFFQGRAIEKVLKDAKIRNTKPQNRITEARNSRPEGQRVGKFGHLV